MKLRLKRNIGALALLLLVAAGMALPQQRRVVTIVPTEPRIGQPMYIVYDPAASEATLKHPLNVTLILNGYARPSVRGKLSSQKVFDMKLSGGKWVKRFVFSDSLRPYFTLYFMERPGVVDDNKGKLWDILLNGEDDKPLPDAHLAKYFALQDLNPPDLDRRQIDELQAEMSMYPDNFRGRYVQSVHELKTSNHPEALKLDLRRKADYLLGRYPDDIGALVYCSNVYRILGDTAAAQQAEGLILSTFGETPDAEILRFSTAFTMRDAEQRAYKLRELLKAYPNSDLADRAHDSVIAIYTLKGDTASISATNAEWQTSKASAATSIIRPVNLEDLVKTVHERPKIDAPDFSFDLTDSSGTVYRRDYIGKILVLQFWANGCPPCNDLFPQLQKTVESYGTNANVGFLVVNSAGPTDSMQSVAKFLSEKHYTFKSAIDRNSATSRLGVVAVPTTIVLDSKGRLAFRRSGNYGADDYKKTIDAVVDVLSKEQ
ncbi:MAG TPA: TlpA disulfide reductase family protein [Bacteroidota bacterium]|nr:TlpA disulfide reductase family protein [Bacteroidota bacterium]